MPLSRMAPPACPRVAEVHAAGQFAHDHHVKALVRGFRAQGTGVRTVPGTGTPGGCSRKAPAPRAGQASARSGRRWPGRPSHLGPPTAPKSTLSHVSAAVDRGIRQRYAKGVDGVSARGQFKRIQIRAYRVQHAHGLGNDLRADPVAPNQSDPVRHAPSSSFPAFTASISPPESRISRMNGGMGATAYCLAGGFVRDHSRAEVHGHPIAFPDGRRPPPGIPGSEGRC